MTSSISRRLIFWLAVPLMLLALCGALIHYLSSVTPGVISSDRRLKEATVLVMARVSVKDGRVVLDAPPPEAIRFALRDPLGHVLAGDGELPAAPLDATSGQAFALARLDQRELRTLTSRLDTSAGPVLITVADSSRADAPAARLGFFNTLLWDFVQLDITLVLVWLGIQLGLRPLKNLRDAIAARSPRDLRPIVETSVPREMVPMVVTLNGLFLRLRQAAQSQQQFIANTAHQLRTPITGMLAQLDLLAGEPAAAPVKDRLSVLQEAVRQLSHSANQLLTLARADPAANVAARNQRVRLDATVADVAARFVDRAVDANIDLGIEVQPVAVMADASLLDDLVSNLVDNALKYTPSGGSVTLRAGERQRRAFLCVEDDGRGIPPEERQRVLQRFYRLPNSPGHGSGLGLAIVDEIARLYDATVSVDGGAGGRGTLVLVQFPEGHTAAQAQTVAPGRAATRTHSAQSGAVTTSK